MTTSPNTKTIELPPKLVDLFNGEARYRVAYGGRSGKSRSFATMAAVRGYIWGQEGSRDRCPCAGVHEQPGRIQLHRD